MLSLNTIKPSSGSKTTSKRVGRWNGSGKWTFAGRGHNGQNKRTWGGVPARFEGGQTPLFRRMPKLKGFSNSLFKTEYNVINLSDLQVLADKGITEVTKEVLLANKIIRKKDLALKLLGAGELKAKVSVKVNKVSETAKVAVEKVGGSIEIL